MLSVKVAHLSWVRSPIEKNINRTKQVMVAITALRERLNNPPPGIEPIWIANQKDALETNHAELQTLLSQIQSAMLIIGCQGGSCLATEARTLAFVSQSMAAEEEGRALLAIQSALNILPSYIGMVIQGAQDSAIALLKYINDLRGIRGVPALNDDAVVTNNLSFKYTSPPSYESDCELSDRQRVFARAADSFCVHYSQAVRDQTEEPWAAMREILADLQRVTNDPVLGCYWWAGEALIDLIIANNCAMLPSMSSALRVVMVATQRMSGGEDAAKVTLTPQKFSSLLNSLSVTRKQTPLSQQVLSHFDVKSNVEQESLDDIQAKLESQSVQTIADISDELKSRLETAMMSFGRALNSKRQEGFEAQTKLYDQAMRTIANIFGIFNESELSDVSFELADSVKGAATKDDLTPELIERVKTQILFLDNKLVQLDRSPAAEYLQVPNVPADIVSKIARETGAQLKKISHQIATHVDSGIGADRLLEALEGLRELSSVYEFAGSKDIANIISGVVNVTAEEISGGVLEESERLSKVARAQVALELYIQYINAGLAPPTNLLGAANDSLRDLGCELGELSLVSRSDLLAKFEVQVEEEDSTDPLLREIFDTRIAIEDACGNKAAENLSVLSAYSTACLRLGAAAEICGEKQFSTLCRRAHDLSKSIPGGLDDPAYNTRTASDLLIRSSESILRAMDDYATKGKVTLFLLEVINELVRFVGHEQPEEAVAAVKFVEVSEPEVELSAGQERELPAGFDRQLKVLFDEDFAQHLETLKSYLAQDDLAVSTTLCRAIHSIHGCSLSASCSAISSLFEVLEARFYSMLAHEQSLTPSQATEFSALLTDVAAYQAEFPWSSDESMLPNWFAIAGILKGDVRTPVVAITEGKLADASLAAVPETAIPQQEPVEVIHEGVKVVEAVQEIVEPSDTEQLGQSMQSDGDASLAEVVADVALLSKDIPVQRLAVIADPHGYNRDMQDIFLEDANTLVQDLQEYAQQWFSDLNNMGPADEIRRAMHTFKGAAAVLEAVGVVNLTHEMESLFVLMVDGCLIPKEHWKKLVMFVINELTTMTIAIRNLEEYRCLPELIEYIQNAVMINELDEIELERVLSNIAQTLSPAEIPDSYSAHCAENAAESSSVLEQQITSPEVVVAKHEIEALKPVDISAHCAENEVTASQAQSVENATEAASETGANGKTRRGYRGMRDRAAGERQAAYERKQTDKALREAGLEARTSQATDKPIGKMSTIVSPTSKQSRYVENLINSSGKSLVTNVRTKARSAEKIKVEVRVVENSVKVANELRASTFRQSSLHHEVMLSLVALREKISVLSMNANQTTLQLRHFNNTRNNYSDRSHVMTSDEERLHLERFNHLSHNHAQLILQIEQSLQDIQDVITQTSLLEGSFSFQNEAVQSLQRDLLQARLVNFENERPVYQQIINIAKSTIGLEVDFTFHGGDTRVDPFMLNEVRSPLTHILNNACSHGIESAAERLAAGKPEKGTITVKAQRRAKTVAIEISDDGRGIDPQKIRAKAIGKGLIKETDELTTEQLLHLIAEPGFSTASAVSKISGRGIGMDVVKAKMAELGGRLHIESVTGQGTTFILDIPITVGSNRALVCRSGDQWFAIPTYNMVQVLDYPTKELMMIKAKPGQPVIAYEGKGFNIVHLADLIGVPDLKMNSAQPPITTCVVLVENAGTRLAIEVDRGVSMPEIHIHKGVGIMKEVKGIIGTTEVHDGTPALVLDVVEMARLNLVLSETGFKPKAYRIRQIKRVVRPRVLIVDDASSYQKLLTRHFQGLGWEVFSALNGQDALDKLNEIEKPDLFIIDVEMPRMNGLDLSRKLRAQRNLDSTPIIMLTTRATVEEEAKAIGVDIFLTKPYHAVRLNEAIETLCPNLSEGAAA